VSEWVECEYCWHSEQNFLNNANATAKRNQHPRYLVQEEPLELGLDGVGEGAAQQVRRHRQVVLDLAQREHPSRLPTCLEQPTTEEPVEERGRRLLGCDELMLEAAPVHPCPVGCGSQRGPTGSERRAA